MLNLDISDSLAAKQLIEIGRKMAEKEGRKEGIKKAKLKTAKKMLKDGFKPNIIRKYTDLTYKEIKNIQL